MATTGGLGQPARGLLAAQQEEDREDADQGEDARPHRVRAGDERGRPGDGDDEPERGANRPAGHHEHADQRREAEDGEQNDAVHEGKVDAVERKLRLVEVEDPLTDPVEDGTEEVALRISWACVRERDVRGDNRRYEGSTAPGRPTTTSFRPGEGDRGDRQEGEQEDRQPVAPARR